MNNLEFAGLPLRAMLVLAAAIGTACLAHPRVEVFRNGDGDFPFIRIPALLRVNDTHLIAFAEGRGQRTDHGRVSIIMRSSADNGATWSPITVVHQEPDRTVGNPTPLFDDPEIVVFFCRGNKEVLETRSTDGGGSWSPPRLLSWVRPSTWAWVAVGPPSALVTSRGRWVLPGDGLIGSAQIYQAAEVFSFVLTSDDRGATWHQAPLLPGGNECQAAELGNGTLVLNMRSVEAVRLHSSSEDGGATWTAPRRAAPPVTDGNCQGSMIALQPPPPPARGVPSAHAEGPEPPLLVATSVELGRRRLTARTSMDGGASWRVLSVVEPGTAGYSALADLGGGWAGCLYEIRKDEEVVSRSGVKRKVQVDLIVFDRINVSAATPIGNRALDLGDAAAVGQPQPHGASGGGAEPVGAATQPAGAQITHDEP